MANPTRNSVESNKKESKLSNPRELKTSVELMFGHSRHSFKALLQDTCKVSLPSNVSAMAVRGGVQVVITWDRLSHSAESERAEPCFSYHGSGDGQNVLDKD
jgi:hypothetical protein